MAIKLFPNKETQIRIAEAIENLNITGGANLTPIEEEISNIKADYVTKTALDLQLIEKQDKLTAGDNITIDPDTNVISASGGGGPVDWADIENKPIIPINTSDLINDSDYTTKTYVDGQIASIDLSDYVTNEDIKEVISGVSYNTLDHKITFNRYNDVDIVVDLPIENLLVGLSLNGDDLVLELEDGTTTSVPLNTLLVGIVKNVNGKTPNSSGVVSLSYNDLNDLPNLFSGNYNDLINKPELFSKDYNDLINLPSLFSGNYEDLLNKPTLTTVATSGSYNDLINLPNLFSGNYNDLINKPELFSKDYNDLTNKPTIPINTSDLTNDSNFTTTTYVDNKTTIKEQNNNNDIMFWNGSQAEYDSLSVKDENTIYFIKEE